eukprot:4227708-Heterocapsa_arctica.AAC.1
MDDSVQESSRPRRPEGRQQAVAADTAVGAPGGGEALLLEFSGGFPDPKSAACSPCALSAS